ncbi:CPBP family intramembrane metalloprotease SdpA [Staphylococcus argenteus]|nr:type II CAAX endopeptidase family protein [Staphylococcus argenteus]CDR21241.1 CAAX amino terminal protease family protein [Staphylococcus argenteus]SGX16570.1 CAAX amino terminal protease family protein [Staphylococcus argenteus]SGX66526.1 CAAX amino terminal protease family protein [Staphylococcus argenteus]SHC31241.1 CAAX amino terminal protease family protein [Staphylococcus argenteus]SHD54637.1 CAAX amino terminal protease family protein [Staphylococcus argenteus]
MIKKFNQFFYDDLSVTQGNYFFTLLKGIFIAIYFLIAIVICELHLLYGLLTIMVGIFLLKILKINLFSLKKITLPQIALIIGGTLLLFGLDNIYLYFHETPKNQQTLENEIKNMPLYFSILTVAVIPALLEEIIFRGILIRVIFRNHLLLGLVVSSLAFASLHESDTWIGYLPYLYSGVIFGLAYLKTRRLEVAILMHFLNNLSSLFIILWG